MPDSTHTAVQHHCMHPVGSRSRYPSCRAALPTTCRRPSQELRTTPNAEQAHLTRTHEHPETGNLAIPLVPRARQHCRARRDRPWQPRSQPAATAIRSTSARPKQLRRLRRTPASFPEEWSSSPAKKATAEHAQPARPIRGNPAATDAHRVSRHGRKRRSRLPPASVNTSGKAAQRTPAPWPDGSGSVRVRGPFGGVCGTGWPQ